MSRYNAEISAGSLMPLESKRVAAFLLTNPDDAAWVHAIEIENILQKNTPATARRQARLIRRRLNTLDADAWQQIAQREHEVSIQLLLVAAVKHSRLLGDFMQRVYADHQRRLDLTLNPSDWEGFLAECTHHDPDVGEWSTSTKAKLFQVVVRILSEAKYLENPKSMKLTPRSLHPDVRRYLAQRHESYALESLERA